ncbi:hypothetical protein EDB80DRAFT_653703 [Ilyonectria destructans]|nr:hypothetical protein EDB80DRAFT_653703 [Ilyonectria destructans]
MTCIPESDSTTSNCGKSKRSHTQKPLHLKMQVRRWKNMSGQSRAVGESSAAAHQTPVSGMTRSRRRVAVQFINASHPRDVISAEAKKKIRSHVAKDIHASRHSRNRYMGEASNRYNNQVEERELAEPNVPLPAPECLLSSSRKDPFQSFARPVTEMEHFLIDHYVTIVIPNSSSYCNHGDAETLFLSGMKSHWLPLVFSDVGLLCGLLLAACRHLLIAGPAVNKQYAGMALLYKGECIKSTNEAVVTEGTSVSDATIGKALIMSSDEFLCGNMEISRLHADAIIRMVSLKGGLRNLGAGGFLRSLVTWCVMHPMFGEGESLILEE